MSAKVVFHIDWEKEERLVMAINNITNLLKAVAPEEIAVCVLANGAAVKLFHRERAFQYAPDIQRLSQDGVRFLVCSNSLNKSTRPDPQIPCGGPPPITSKATVPSAPIWIL